MIARRAALVGVFLGLTTLFGGRYGLIGGAAIVGVWWALGRQPRVLWIAAVALMAAAPIALMAQGLPRRPVVGPGFGTDHLLAHVLVGLSLAAAGLAALAEVLPPDGGEPGRGRHRSGSGVTERTDPPPPTEAPRRRGPADPRQHYD